MATARDIKRKINSVKNIQQITKAMKLIATTKMQKSQNAIINARPYANSIYHLMSRVLQRSREVYCSLLEKRGEVKVTCFLVITSERGFCGGFNSNVIKAITNLIKDKEKESKNICMLNLGSKGYFYFKRQNYKNIGHYPIQEPIEYSLSQDIGSILIEKYISKEIDEAYITFNEFKSLSTQRVMSLRILPLNIEPEIEEKYVNEYIYEPDPIVLLQTLIARYINIQIHKALLESFAAEQCARMVAMDSATKNAKEMISNLQLNYNRVRQAAITKEISEIIGGREALSI
ncbi:MAG: ATP synthase F1 subunit gamma [bacterium]|nr:ATP synthase F1 subunit gamma [bacterium]